MTPFFGKYRGRVVRNQDPDGLGRVLVSVPQVYGDDTSHWAMPCTPYAGPHVGLFLVPPERASVWVEFEGGNPVLPIWSGCFWEERGDVPASPAVPGTKVLKTDGVTLTIRDTQGSGGLTLEVASPAVSSTLRMVFDSSGIELTVGSSSVKLSTASVSVNNGALEVT